MIDALFSIRDQIARIYEGKGGATDIYGRTLKIERKKGKGGKLNTFSVLAQVVQAAELHLVMPVYDLAIEEEQKTPGRFTSVT